MNHPIYPSTYQNSFDHLWKLDNASEDGYAMEMLYSIWSACRESGFNDTFKILKKRWDQIQDKKLQKKSKDKKSKDQKSKKKKERKFFKPKLSDPLKSEISGRNNVFNQVWEKSDSADAMTAREHVTSKMVPFRLSTVCFLVLCVSI